ncbi:MAG: DUF4292 domain-containing protein [Tannerella sp.]|jgi:hypothetical protein|nr:DUF4292 domain-containing protein [Tannerella sp.]
MKTELTALFRTGSCCLLCCILLAGCRTSHAPATAEANLLEAEEAFFNTLRKQSFQYRTLTARIQFELSMASEKSFSSRANLKIRRNSRIQLSIQPLLGIEAFRVELSPDSILVIDRLNKRYLSEAFGQIKGDAKIDFNFYNLQALFTNQLFLPGEAELPENAFHRFRWKQTETGYALQTEDQTKLQYIFMADRQEKLYASRITDAAAHYALHWEYTDFRPAGEQLFPMKIHAGWFVDDASKGALALNYSRIEIDAPVEINSVIPPGYEPVNFSQILKMLK